MWAWCIRIVRTCNNTYTYIHMWAGRSIISTTPFPKIWCQERGEGGWYVRVWIKQKTYVICFLIFHSSKQISCNFKRKRSSLYDNSTVGLRSLTDTFSNYNNDNNNSSDSCRCSNMEELELYICCSSDIWRVFFLNPIEKVSKSGRFRRDPS